jgi:hypothetical protein
VRLNSRVALALGLLHAAVGPPVLALPHPIWPITYVVPLRKPTAKAWFKPVVGG